MTEGAGFSGRYANKPLPDVSGVRFGLKLLLVSSGIIVLVESLPAASHLSILSLLAFASGSLASSRVFVSSFFLSSLSSRPSYANDREDKALITR